MSLKFCLFGRGGASGAGGAGGGREDSSKKVVCFGTILGFLVGRESWKKYINDFGENRNRDLAHYLYIYIIFFPLHVQAGQPREPQLPLNTLL